MKKMHGVCKRGCGRKKNDQRYFCTKMELENNLQTRFEKKEKFAKTNKKRDTDIVVIDQILRYDVYIYMVDELLPFLLKFVYMVGYYI